MNQLLEHFKELTLYPKNAEELKGLILQLAIEGNLTKKWREENPDVDSAEILLDQLELEKKELIKRKQIKKEKPLEPINENEKIPSPPTSWELIRLGEIGDWGAGATPSRSRSDFYGGNINWYKSGELNNGIIDYNSKETINELALKNSSLRLNKIGDVLIAMYGATIGKTAILAVEGATNQAVCACTPFSCISNVYLHLLLKALKGNFIDQGEGGAQPNISRVKIRNQVFALPPLEEQKAIVAIVNQLIAEVEQLEALTKKRIKLKTDFVTSALNQLSQAADQDVASRWAFIQEQFGTFFTEKSTIKKLRESILQLAVQGKLTHHWRTDGRLSGVEVEPASDLLEKIKVKKASLIKAGKIKKEKPLPEVSEEEIPYELPEGWVWCRFGELIIDIEAGKSPKCLPETANFDEWGVIKMSAISWGAFNGKENKALPKDETPFEDKEVKPGDFILTRANTSDLIAKSVIVPDSVRAKLLLNDKTLRIRFSNLISPEFLNLYNNGGQAREHYKKVSSGTSDSMQNISRENIKLLILPLPRLEEQKAIVEKVNALMTLCDKLEQEIDIHQNTQKQWMQGCLREVVKAKAPDELP
ncbi:restriction endonuclease subunit S [Cyclobacterium xiamenense]|uniref:restriction endonuclease subunit S n=1 Tax=Cyclobacterium xiamenense TaxID=1297121 RepID=UPI0035CEBE8E